MDSKSKETPIMPDQPLVALGLSSEGVRQFTGMEVGQVHDVNLEKHDFSRKTIRGISEHLRRMVVHVCGVRHEDRATNFTNVPSECPIRNLTSASPDLNLACAHPGHVASVLAHYISVLQQLKRIDSVHADALQKKLEGTIAELSELDGTAITTYEDLGFGPEAEEKNAALREDIKAQQKVIGEKMADIVRELGEEFDSMLIESGAVPREGQGVTHEGHHWTRYENRLFPYESTIAGVRFYATLPDEIDAAATQIATAVSAAQYNATLSRIDMSYADLIDTLRQNIVLPSGIALSKKQP